MDRVRFEDDERLDIPDTKALQTLVYEYIGRFLGAMMGRPLYEKNTAFGGWLVCNTTKNAAGKNQAEPFTLSADFNTLSISSGQFYSATFTNAGVTAEILQYNPSSTQQDTVSLDLSSFRSTKTPFTIWAYPQDTPSNTENRKFWDALAQNEVTGTLATRTARTIAFVASSGSNAPSNVPSGVKPFKIGKCTDFTINENIPSVLPVFAFDAKFSESMNQLTGDSYLLQLQGEGVDLENTGFGLIGHMQALRTNIAALYDSDFSKTGSTWLDPTLVSTSVGIQQIDEQLTKLESVLESNGLTEAGEFAALSSDFDVLNKKVQHVETLFNSGSLCVRSWARFNKDGALTDFSAGVFGKNIKPYGGPGSTGAGIEGGAVRQTEGIYAIRFYYYIAGSTGGQGSTGPGMNYKNFNGQLFKTDSPFGCVHVTCEHPSDEVLFDGAGSHFRSAGVEDLGTGTDSIGSFHDYRVVIANSANQVVEDTSFTIMLLGPGKSV